MSSPQHQLSLSRPRPGRPSKGDRPGLFVRVPPGLAQRFADAAVTADVSQSEHMADILFHRYYWQSLDHEGQGQRPAFSRKDKSDRVDLAVRVPRDLRNRFVDEAALAHVSQSDLMTLILIKRYEPTVIRTPGYGLREEERGVVRRRSA
jgi:hypothetical protein